MGTCAGRRTAGRGRLRPRGAAGLRCGSARRALHEPVQAVLCRVADRPGAFTYVFGDLDPEAPDHAQAILDLIPLYRSAPEGFLARDARPGRCARPFSAVCPPSARTARL